jgi:hypothetical protein
MFLRFFVIIDVYEAPLFLRGNCVGVFLYITFLLTCTSAQFYTSTVTSAFNEADNHVGFNGIMCCRSSHHIDIKSQSCKHNGHIIVPASKHPSHDESFPSQNVTETKFPTTCPQYLNIRSMPSGKLFFLFVLFMKLLMKQLYSIVCEQKYVGCKELGLKLWLSQGLKFLTKKDKARRGWLKSTT